MPDEVSSSEEPAYYNLIGRVYGNYAGNGLNDVKTYDRNREDGITPSDVREITAYRPPIDALDQAAFNH